MKKLILLFILMNFLTLISLAKAETLSLDSVMNQAINQSFDLKISQVDIDISKADIKAAKSDYYPKVDFVYNQEYALDLTKSSTNFSSVGSTFVNNSTKFQNLLAAKLEHTLIDFGIRGKKTLIAKKDLNEKQLIYNQHLRDLKSILVDIYSKALIDYTDIRGKENMLPVYTELFEIKQKLYTSGTTSKLDIMNEAINIAKANDEIEHSKSSLNNNLADLTAYTFQKYENNTELEAIDSETQESTGPVFKQSVEEEVFIPSSSLEFKIYQLEIEKKQKELEILKKERLPIINFYTNYIFYGSDPSNYLKSFDEIRNKNLSVGINLALPVFDGFKNSAQQEKVLLEIQKLTLEQQKYSSEIENKYNKLYEQYKSLQNEMNTKESLIIANQDKLNALTRLSQQSLIDKSTLLTHKATVMIDELELRKIKIQLKSTLKQLEILLEG